MQVSNRALEDRHWTQIFGILGGTYDAGSPFCVQDLIKWVSMHAWRLPGHAPNCT